LIFENPGTTVRRRVLSQEKGFPSKSIEKEIVKKMERFPKVFAIQAHLVRGKGKRLENQRRSRL